MPTLVGDLAAIRQALLNQGLSRLSGPQLRAILGAERLVDWGTYARSWDDLGPDRFMADGGRYRRRRFGCFAVHGNRVTRKPHQPHFQAVDHNPLNGGIDRWFEPITEAIGEHGLTKALLIFGRQVFDGVGATPWHVEVHQFRIEAAPGAVGKPTPEGLHRDGVDWVLVMLVARHNVAGGVTEIQGSDRQLLGEFLLSDPLDAVLLDDRRVYHGVTPLEAIDPTQPAWRDVLVVTFRPDPSTRNAV